jgi:fructoselysine-6-P-deglycase FrlB-like protein
MFASYNEIFLQGESLRKTFDYVSGRKEEIKTFFKETFFEEVVFVGCGSSYWMSVSACMTLRGTLGMPCSAVTSGDIVLHPEEYKQAYKNPLIIVPTRSGSTTETLLALQFLKDTYHCKILSITEYTEAPIYPASDLVLEIPWANETSVCQTRSFSNLYLAAILLGALLGENSYLLEDLSGYIYNFEGHRQRAENLLGAMLKEFPECHALVALGSGRQFGVTCEGAYICIEMAQFHSTYYNTLELRHGPIVMLDKGSLVVLFSGGNKRDLEEGMAADARKKGAKVAVICEGDTFKHCDYCFSLGRKASPEAVALFGVFVLQGFAYLKAVSLGIDPDNPKELVPWIQL